MKSSFKNINTNLETTADYFFLFKDLLTSPARSLGNFNASIHVSVVIRQFVLIEMAKWPLSTRSIM